MADKQIKLLVKAEVDKAIRDFKKLDKEVDKTTKSKRRMRVGTEGLTRQIGVLRNKVLLASFAFAAIGATIGKVVATSARFEALETRLVALKGSVDEGRKAFEFFNSVAKTTPFQLENVVEAGAQLEAFGADSEKTLKAVSDLAAFMGTDIVEAANSFGRAFAGGAGAADVLRERGVLTQVKLATGFDDLSKMTLPQFREALINTLTDPDGNIAGATDLLSQTFSGLVSNFQDSLSQLQDSIGDLLAPAIKSVISFLKEGVDDITEGFKRLNESPLEITIRQLKEAGNIGTLAHKMIEEYINGGSVCLDGYTPNEVSQAKTAYYGFHKWFEDNDVEFYETELKLVSEEYQFGGTMDAVCEVNGKLILADWKTSSDIYSEYLIQAAAYRQLYTEYHNYDHWYKIKGATILKLDKDVNGYVEHKFNISDLNWGWKMFKLLLKIQENKR